MPRQSRPRPEQPVVTRYVDADGRRCKKSAPGARKVTTRSESYFARLKDAEGERRWHALDANDLSRAWESLRKLLDERAREEAGLGGPCVKQASRPLSDHLAEWSAQLRAGGRTSEKQIGTLAARVRKLAELAGWHLLGHVQRDGAIKALAKLQSERTANIGDGYAGRGNQTRNHYLRAIKQFCSWCVLERRIERSPVEAVQPLNVAVDLRHARRAPTEGEVALLMAYCEGPGAAVRCRMSGPVRALGYRVCMATGLRAGELRSLGRESFDLDAGTVTCRARSGKNRRQAVQHLPPWLVEELRAYFAGGGGGWRFPAGHPGRLLIADLEAAGVAYSVEGPDGPLYFDFHSMRHFFVTWAANQPGISPKALQQIVRHSDARLTLERYAKHARESEAKKLADAMPRPGG